MPATFHMRIKDLFFLRDGRTVLVGAIEEEEKGAKIIVVQGPATILLDGKEYRAIHLEGEDIPSRSVVQEPLSFRAVSTPDQTGLTKEDVETRDCRLEGTMRYSGHRHLLGI